LAKDKKGGKGKKASRAITDTATQFLGEVEKTGEALVTEVKQVLDGLTDKLANLASAATETTASVAEKVRHEPAELMRGVVNDVTEAGEASLRAIGERFDTLRQELLGGAEKAGPAKKEKKKAKNKDKAEKKPVVKKSAKKKAVTKKTAARKSVKKKSSAKKAVAAKKVAGSNKGVATNESSVKATTAAETE
jgi:ribonuclease E